MKKKIEELKNEGEKWYDSVTLYYDDGDIRTIADGEYELIGVSKYDDVVIINLNDYYRGLYHVNADGSIEEWYYHKCNTPNKKVIAYEFGEED